MPGFTRSIMLVARAAGLNGLADQFAAVIDPTPVRLPSRRLRPAGGFRTDPALLYALARLESNFDPEAVSPMGARGLMQLMPSTVDFILGETRHGRGACMTRRPTSISASAISCCSAATTSSAAT